MLGLHDSYPVYPSPERRLDNSKGAPKDLDNFVDQLVKHLHNCGNEVGVSVCLCNRYRSGAGCRRE